MPERGVEFGQSPSVRCEFEMADDHDHDLGARMAGSSRMVNAIPAVCAARPGLLSAPAVLVFVRRVWI